MHACLHAYIHTHTTFIYGRTDIHAYIHVFVHVYIYLYIYIRTSYLCHELFVANFPARTSTYACYFFAVSFMMYGFNKLSWNPVSLI